MVNQESRAAAELNSLEGIRSFFEARQRELGRGFHALGEDVFTRHDKSDGVLPRPVSAMTFRNFLQGKTTLRDPTGLELYFEELGANPAEMKVIRATLLRELDRKIASPRQNMALKGFEDADLDTMSLSRALAECELVTRVEGSISAVVSHLTPREYLLGADGSDNLETDSERWGLLQHLEELTQFMATLDKDLTEAAAQTAKPTLLQKRVQAAADLREAATAYATWLVHRPRAADLLFSRRRFMLHGYFPEEERGVAIALSKRIARIVFGFLERFAHALVGTDKQEAAALRTPAGENALELVAQRVLAIVDSFYIGVVQGSQGTGALYRAQYQLRRENRHTLEDWTTAHELTITRYDAAVHDANQLVDEDVRVPYRVLRAVYDDQFRAMRDTALAVWESDFAGGLARQASSLLLSELHVRGVIGDAAFLTRTKELAVGKIAAQIATARHARRMFEAPFQR